jgi:hypothetical protein
MESYLSVTEAIYCPDGNAIQFQIELNSYNLQLKNAGHYMHPFEVKYTKEDGLFIYAEGFTEDHFDSQILRIFRKLIISADRESILFSYCVINDGFSPMSHHCGTIVVYLDGTMEMF